MRKIATLASPVGDIRRLMIFVAAEGTYLFLYTSPEDGPCKFDQWFESPQDAEQAAADSFGVGKSEWVAIDEPQPGAQQDWIKPTRIKRDLQGKALHGQFEAIPQAE